MSEQSEKNTELSSDDGDEEESSSKDSNGEELDNVDEYQEFEIPCRELSDYEAIGQKYEIQPHHLMIIKQIGKGFYSDVQMGVLSSPAGDVPVAVKTAKNRSLDPTEHKDILKLQRKALRDELDIFLYLQSTPDGGHENVIKLVGKITTIKADFCILTEYCELGSMDHFLQKKWKNGKFEDELLSEAVESEKIWKMQVDPSWSEDYHTRRESGLITTSDLLWFALQIARAMQFLAEKKVIHRDVALRNVLLKSDFTLKIADFGLSRKLLQSDDSYYVWQQKTALPIRYLAPESLKFGRFATTSEFWSFGVVVWELFTFAEKQPYSTEFENQEGELQFRDFLVEYLFDGHRLSIPNNVPKAVKKLISDLWHFDPKERPSFQTSRSFIRQELLQSCPNMLERERVSIQLQERILLRSSDEDSKVETLNNRSYVPLNSPISSFTVKEVVSTETPARWKEISIKNVVLGIGILSTMLIAIILTLTFTVFVDKSSFNGKSATNNTDVYLPNKGWYLQQSKEGDPEAQILMGNFHSTGHGLPQSDVEAAKWYRKAAELGDATGQRNLARAYDTGRGVGQSDEEALKWYKMAAAQGNAVAQYSVGQMYRQGRAVNRSDQEAFKWYQKAAEKGYTVAQNSIGDMYRDGQGVNQSDAEAVKWFRKAAELGNTAAQNNLGWMYKNGRGVNRSDEEAEKWFKKAELKDDHHLSAEIDVWYRSAEERDADAQVFVGNMYNTGNGLNQSYEEAAKWYRKAAELGDATGQRNLGWVFDTGLGLRQSDEDGFKWYKMAADQGNSVAQYRVGQMYRDGQGIDPSDTEALKWYRKSAEQGYLRALDSLGYMYRSGRGVNQSDQEAVKWFRKAAEQGMASGQSNLAWMYRMGRGVNQSDEEAVKWYRRAAEQNNADGQNNLGWMYELGRGVNQSDEEAVKWYTKAAEQGVADALKNLGNMYRDGRGVEQSDEEAIKLYNKAVEQGDKNAQTNLKSIYESGRGVSTAPFHSFPSLSVSIIHLLMLVTLLHIHCSYLAFIN